MAILDRINGATAPSAAMARAEVVDAILQDCERRDATGEFSKSHLGAWDAIASVLLPSFLTRPSTN